MTYYKPASSPQLLAKRFPNREDQFVVMTRSDFLVRNSRPAGNSARMTMMTRLADNTIAKKRGDVTPATAAATKATKARGSVTLASSGAQCCGCRILISSRVWSARQLAGQLT